MKYDLQKVIWQQWFFSKVYDSSEVDSESYSEISEELCSSVDEDSSVDDDSVSVDDQKILSMETPFTTVLRFLILIAH